MDAGEGAGAANPVDLLPARHLIMTEEIVLTITIEITHEQAFVGAGTPVGVVEPIVARVRSGRAHRPVGPHIAVRHVVTQEVEATIPRKVARQEASSLVIAPAHVCTEVPPLEGPSTVREIDPFATARHVVTDEIVP